MTLCFFLFRTEMCLTSNLKVETVASYDVHHLGYWYFKKHPLIICVSITKILFLTIANTTINMYQVPSAKISSKNC